MHVYIAGHSSALYGAELSMYSLAQCAKEAGYRVTASVPTTGPLVERLNQVCDETVVVATAPWMGRRHSLPVGAIRIAQATASIRSYQRLIDRVKPDAVLTNSAVIPAPAYAARRCGVPHVWYVGESFGTNPTLRSALHPRQIASRLSNLSARTIAVSRFVAAQLATAYPPISSKLSVIPPPALADRLGPLPRPTMRKPGPLRVLLAGSFSPEKGQMDAVRAVGECYARNHHVELRLVGGGHHRMTERIQSSADSLGVSHLVTIESWTNGVEALYQWADVVLMLSKNEAFGLVTVEALSYGCPVVGYDRGSTPELLSAGGGICVDPDPRALASALGQLASDPSRLEQLTDATANNEQRLAEYRRAPETILSVLRGVANA
ncbi:glycosyltransferase family 4 protein [Cryptosporangium arvum]|uniref:glycosyltransferase family 4 protein n=1 Tax=Cryptosporangium arvum TaxID=80871 RepID=UPI000A00ADF8|nr:glycosyltransferase family 4 protein [Cryptosporangium arvum]